MKIRKYFLKNKKFKDIEKNTDHNMSMKLCNIFIYHNAFLNKVYIQLHFQVTNPTLIYIYEMYLSLKSQK